MNIREISKPVTARSLNENLAKKFGQKIDIDRFTLEQLQDARNKVRTKLSQVETNESFNEVHNDAYQKSKMFLDVLNAAIAEREDIAEKAKPDYLDLDGDGDTKEPMKKAAKDAKKKKKVDEKAVSKDQQQAAGAALAAKRGETPKSNLKGASKEMMKMSTKELEKFAGTKHKGLPNKKTSESQGPSGFGLDDETLKSFRKEVNKAAKREKDHDEIEWLKKRYGEARMESVIREGAEDQAEIVMAAKGMVDKVTSWLEDTAEMQTESMLELADAIRDEMGSEQSETFIATIKPALEALYTTMEETRGTLTTGVGILTGESEPTEMMGDEEPEMEPTVDAEAGAEAEVGAEAGDEFAAAEPAAGGEEEAGRAKRESIERSRRLAGILTSKKK